MPSWDYNEIVECIQAVYPEQRIDKHVTLSFTGKKFNKKVQIALQNDFTTNVSKEQIFLEDS